MCLAKQIKKTNVTLKLTTILKNSSPMFTRFCLLKKTNINHVEPQYSKYPTIFYCRTQFPTDLGRNLRKYRWVSQVYCISFMNY